MKYFNEKEFRGWKNVDDIFERPDNDRFLKKDNKRVRIMKDEEGIMIERTFIDSPYRNVEIYYPNHNIKLWGDEFYSFPIGIWLHYDEIGRKIKEENLDVDYKFSIKDLIQKFQKEYNIDIEDPKNVHYCNRLFPKDIGAIYEIGHKYKYVFPCAIEHPLYSNGEPLKATTNVMSYRDTRYSLWRWQWNFINPKISEK